MKNIAVMEKNGVTVILLLVLSNIFALASVGSQSWVVNTFSGTTTLGLTKICILFKGQDSADEVCEALTVPSYWAVTLVFIVIGVSLSFLTTFMVFVSVWKTTSPREASYRIARIVGFLTMVFFCIGCIVFPFGFSMPEIGGQAYKLPAHTKVGFSYYLFCAAMAFETFAVALCNTDVIRHNFAR